MPVRRVQAPPKFVLIAALLSVLAVADVSRAATAGDWEAGRRAFAEGDYETALEHFETAREAGLDSAAVYYNIAVTRYRLGQFEVAGEAFETIAERFPRMAGLAEYNLGLVARRLGDEQAALVRFRRALDLSSGDPKLRALAAAQLPDAGPEGRSGPRWVGAFGANAGSDDNVALRDEAGLPTGTTTDSSLFDLFGSISGPWRAESGFRVQAAAYAIRYPDADEFDQSEIRGAAYYDWRPGDWRIEAGIQLSAGGLGGDAFDRKAGIRARALHPLGRDAVLDVRFNYDDVNDADTQFAGVEGSRRQVEVRYRWYRGGHRWQFRVALESNDRLDPGVSPDRRSFGVDYRYQPDRGFGVEAGLGFRSSDYDGLELRREEDLASLGAALTYAFRDGWTAVLEFRTSDNDSTDPEFGYDRNRLTLGVLKYFRAGGGR